MKIDQPLHPWVVWVFLEQVACEHFACALRKDICTVQNREDANNFAFDELNAISVVRKVHGRPQQSLSAIQVLLTFENMKVEIGLQPLVCVVDAKLNTNTVLSDKGVVERAPKGS